jgi:hypothetical protein
VFNQIEKTKSKYYLTVEGETQRWERGDSFNEAAEREVHGQRSEAHGGGRGDDD